MNLALNAAEAIGSHDGLITVRTGVQDVDERYIRLHPEAAALRPGKYVYLEVRDTGCGMDDATRARIFDPFFSTKFTGRGLGLAAVAGILRGHKGAIAVSSAPGKGSCFTVLFPAAARVSEERPAAPRSTALRGSGVVLVVDDEQLVREMAKKALERYGYTVLLAESGLAAIDLLRRHPGDIALVVLDLSMPRMSGEEALPGTPEDPPRGQGPGVERLQRVRDDDDVQRPAGFRLHPETVHRGGSCGKGESLPRVTRANFARANFALPGHPEADYSGPRESAVDRSRTILPLPPAKRSGQQVPTG